MRQPRHTRRAARCGCKDADSFKRADFEAETGALLMRMLPRTY
jgi:hypothetical protein